jgi:hypothetical protein
MTTAMLAAVWGCALVGLVVRLALLAERERRRDDPPYRNPNYEVIRHEQST